MKFSLKDDINSISYFKSNYNKVLKKIKNTKRPLIITQNGKSSGVFMDIDTWENFIRKINLMKLINDGELSLKKDKLLTLEEVEKNLKKKFDL